jgi:hypothetical protein
MKNFITTLIMLLTLAVLVSCGTAGRFTASSREDKDLFKAINALDKSNHPEARKDLPALYQQSVLRHQDQLAAYRNSSDAGRWPKIIAELEALQNIYSAVSSSQAASLVTAKDYSAELRNAREEGAAEYYETGMQYMESDRRQDARKAYQAFQSANKLQPNFRNTAELMREAREKGTLDVVINPVGNSGYMYPQFSNFTSDNFQRSLVRDLGGSFGNAFNGARFYTDWDARSMNVTPDWVVDLNWENLNIGVPRTHTFTRSVSNEIEAGKDSSGRTIYRTVHATLRVTRYTLSARASMAYRITDIYDRSTVRWSTIPAYLDINTEYATYSGDSRALSSHDWALVNNRRNGYYDDREIVEALYGRIYPELRSRIESDTRW